MSEQLPAPPPWASIAKRNTGEATSAELATNAQWLAQNTLPMAEGQNQIDVTFADEAVMMAWLRMQQRSKRLTMTGTNWLLAYGNTLLPITAAEIAHFANGSGQATLTTLKGQTHAVALTLDELETTLAPSSFSGPISPRWLRVRASPEQSPCPTAACGCT